MSVTRQPPGPGMWQTYRRLRNTPLREFPVFLRELQQEYGNVSAFRVPWRRFYFLNDPAAIKEVLIAQQHSFVKSEGTRAMRELLGEGLVTSEEPLHRRMRRIVQPAFHRQRIAAYAQTMHEYAQAWRPPQGTFNMHAEMMELTLRIASKTLFGVDAGAQADTVGAALHEVVTIFPDVLGPFGWITRRLPLPPTLRFRKARRILDEIVLELIAQRRASFDTAQDDKYTAQDDKYTAQDDKSDDSALSMLLQARDEETGEGLSDAQVRDEVMTLFVAGHETTANALTWTWYLLAKHPDVREQLRAQLRADPQTPYLDAVLSETLRLYPPAWILGRDALREVNVEGWRIRKGATVLMSQLVMHRSPRYFEQPERFIPERWLQEQALPQFAYFPFGGGARKCLGDQFAWTEARIELSHLAQRYCFELGSGADVVPDPIITLRPAGPVWMRAV
jgi:cytochrome P450